MIKVLHTEWSDGWGGQEIRIINEMIAVREKNIEVYLACRNQAKIKQKAIENDIRVFTLPFDGAYDIKTIRALIKIIKENGIDIVNTHSGKDTWTGGIAAKLAGVKFIRTRHLSNPINPSRFNFINELADFIFTTGESVKNAMIKNNRIKPEKIMSVPTGIDENIFDPKKYDSLKIREKYGIKKDEITIGIIAVLRGFKRHEMFIDMANLISKKFPKCKFFIAGEGPRRAIIENLIKEKNLETKIQLLGHIDDPFSLLSALDIFVLTSDKNEGVPQSIIQALMMNKAVIATDVGGTKDLLNNNNFFILAPNNLQQLVRTITLLIENKTLRETYASSARNSILKKFSQTHMAENIKNIYNLTLGIK